MEEEKEIKEKPFDNASIIFQPYDWKFEEPEDNFENIRIRCHALTHHTDEQESESVLVRISDFPVSCYLELPPYVNGRKINWLAGSGDIIISKLSSILKDDRPTSATVTKRWKLYYYQPNRSSYIFLTFKNSNALRHCGNIVKKPLFFPEFGTLQMTMWQNRISPIRKLITVKNMTMTQWSYLDIAPVAPEDKISIAKHEFHISYKDLKPIDPKYTSNWVTYPGRLSFDIETYSANHNKFPGMYNEKDVAYMISAIYQKGPDKSKRKRYGILFGRCNNIPEEVFPNTEIVNVNDEIELVKAFANLINDLDPEVISGYNIFGFDYPYLHARLDRKLEDWPRMSRIIGQETTIKRQSWKSNAYGSNVNYILEMEGRVNIDMLPAVKRQYRMRSYKLDTVSQFFLGKTKHDISAKEMFQIYKQTLDANRSKDEQQIENAKREMTRVMLYCIQDSELVLDLMDKLSTWLAMIETSSICGVPVSHVDTRGQQIRVFSQIYDMTTKTGYVINSREIKETGFEGGLVPEPIQGVHDPVLYMDFAAMYPNIIIAKNLCYTTLVPPELWGTISDEKCNILEFDQEEKDQEDDKKKVIRHYKYKFLKKSVKEGILPKLCEHLLKSRKRVKVLMKKSSGIQHIIYNQRQLAIKVSANSIFGFTGTGSRGMLPCVEIPRSICGTGRDDIRTVNKILKKLDPSSLVVYGDTDSTMITISEKDPKKCWEIGEVMAEEINKYFRDIGSPNVEIELERVARMLLITKKRYALYEYNKNGILKCSGACKCTHHDGKTEIDMHSKGTLLARRESCLWVKKLYGQILRNILNKVSFQDTMSYLINNLKMLLGGKVPPEELSLNKKMGQGYKSDSYLMAVFARRLKRQKQLVTPEERLEYIIIDNTAEVEAKERRQAKEEHRLLKIKYLELILEMITSIGSYRKTLKVWSIICNNLEADSVSVVNILRGKVETKKKALNKLKNLSKENFDVMMELIDTEYENIILTILKVHPSEEKLQTAVRQLKSQSELIDGDDEDFSLLGNRCELLYRYNSYAEKPPIDYMYYITNQLINPIDQVMGIGYKDDIKKFPEVGYRPTTRHKKRTLEEPIKMMSMMLERGEDIEMIYESISL